MASLLNRTLRLTPMGDGAYARDIDDTWWGWNGQFGGYVLALALEACRDENTDPAQRERSISMHFLRRVPEGACRIAVETERKGRTVTTFSLRMFVEGRLVAVGLVLFGSDRRSEDFITVTSPDLDAPSVTEEPQPSLIPGKALQNLDIWPRHGNDVAPEAAESGGWMRLKEPEGCDERFLLIACDAYMPVSFLRLTEPSVGGTLDLTAHFRNPIPAKVLDGSEPVRVHLASAAGVGGYVDEDATVWSADGQLLLQSRQVRYSEIVDDISMLEDMRRSG